jgi:hypothetical protein
MIRCFYHKAETVIFFYVLLTVHPCKILQINSTTCTILLCIYIYISLLYMFRANMCPSSGEITVSMRHWYLSLQPADQTAPIQSGKYQSRVDTVISPDDGHMIARNVYRREINILDRSVHVVGFIYKTVQGCSQQNNKIHTFRNNG